MISEVISAGEHEVSEALGLWEPKRTLTLEAARKHSKRIKHLQLLLITVSGGLLAYVIYELATGNTSSVFDDVNPTESVKMVGPRYSGRTDSGQPYYLTADNAVRTLASRNEVFLKNPVLEFIRNNDAAPSFITAKTGTYNDMTKVLNLEIAVDLNTDDGNVCKTAQAKIFTREQRIEGDKRIECNGNFGIANGNAFEIKDTYKTFIFKNGMDAIIQKETASNGTTSVQKGQAFGDDTPINLTADQATYMGGLTVLVGSVDVTQGQNRTKSNEMDIFRSEVSNDEKGSLKLGKISRIDAKGDFRYTTPDTDVTGDRGVYQSQEEIMTITGKVNVKQSSGNTAETNKLVYNVKTESIRFAGDCKGNDCKTGRQRFTIRP